MKIQTSIPVTGVILAGGRGLRMDGRDKGLVQYRGQRMIEHVIDVFTPQVDELLINANRNSDVYGQYGYTVIADELQEYPGPLAGMLAGLAHATHDHVAFVPCDTPALPAGLVRQLLRGLQHSRSRACYACDGEHAHPVIALLHTSMRASLARYLATGQRKVRDWLQQVEATPVEFFDAGATFANINSCADMD